MLQSEQVLWAVCAAFYLSDLVKLPGPKRLLVEKRGHIYWPLVPLYRFLLLGRAFTVLNPFTPWRTTLGLSWLMAGPRPSHVEVRAIRKARVISGRLSSLRWASALVLFSTLVLGPIITESKGLVAALLVVLPILLATWIILALVMFQNRTMLGLTRLRVVGVLAECAICPGYFANVWRRLSQGVAFVGADAIAFCAGAMTSSELNQMCRSMAPYLEDFVVEEELAETGHAAVAAYQAFFEQYGGVAWDKR